MVLRELVICAVMCAVLLPGFALAQTADPAQKPLTIPVQGQDDTTTLVITVKSTQSNRYLGDVQIRIGSKSYKVSDPPLREGLRISNVPIGKVEIVAERKFYSIWNQSITLSKKQYNEVEIKLSPLADVPRVDLSLTNTSMRNSYLPTNNWNGGLSSSVLNPFLDLGNFGNSSTIGNLLQALINRNNPIFGSSGSSQSSMRYLSGQTISAKQINYSFQRADNGDTYFVNNQNATDSRKVIFVDRGDGKGGLAFIPAGTTLNASYNVQSEPTWYTTLYQINNDGNLMVNDKLTKSSLTPQGYSDYLKTLIAD